MVNDSQYPNSLDDDRQLIRVDNNITEIGGDAINGLRSAVFNIEQTLGVNPHGSASDVSARLNQSLNPDGTIKASALSAIGLVTLPITNSMVASNAGIVESKLQLDYNTKQLRELIGALRIEHDALVLTVQGDITNLSRHVAHPSSFGRHRTSDIDGYLGTYAGYNLQGIINDLDTRIIDHISDPIDAHDASAISFDDTETYINANEVQTAIEKLDNLGITTVRIHQDGQHSNGVSQGQETFVSNGHGSTVVVASSLNSITVGATSISYTTIPSSLAQVLRGDRIDITIGSETYTRYVDSVNSTFGIVSFFQPLPVGGVGATAIIYKSSEETSTPSALNLTIRNEAISSSVGGTGAIIQLIHPDAPYLLSNGLDVRLITSNNKNIKFVWANGETSNIDAYQALQNFPSLNSTPSTWTAENLVIALNNQFKADGYNYPIVAFNYLGEIGFALDEPDGYLSLGSPSDNAWAAFGFSGSEIAYARSSRKFYIDGYEFSSIRKIVDTTGTTDGSVIIKNINADLNALGVGQVGIVRIKNHADAGTYVFNASTSNSLTISSHTGGFASDTNVYVEIYADSFAIPITPLNRVLYEMFIDGCEGESGELKAAARVEYMAGGGSGGNPQSWFDLKEISRDFTNGTKRIHFQNVGGEYRVALGNPVTSPATSKDITNAGKTVILPDTNAEGFTFRLYDYNNVDYMDLEIVDDAFTTLAAGEERAIDFIIHKRISEEKYVQVGQVLHNTDKFKNLSDRRLFGTVGRKDIRNDYTRDYISYPRSLLRGNGVIYGCEIESGPSVTGGQVLVDGNIYSINQTSFKIPTDGSSATYNIFVDSDGVLKFWQNDQNATTLITPSVSEIINSSDKVLLGQVDITAGGNISEIRDCRRFVNNFDNKIDLIVEEYEVTHGSFSSLRSAINYINAAGSDAPNSVTLRLRGTVTHDISNSLTVPDGITITGDSPAFVSVSGGAKLELTGTGTSFITVSNGVNLKNLHISMKVGSSCTKLISGTNITGLNIENCIFDNLLSTSTMAIVSGTNVDYMSIRNSSFTLDSTNNFAYAIEASGTLTNSIIENSIISYTGTNTQLAMLTSSIDTLTINNVDVTFSSTSGNYVVSAVGNIANLNITDLVSNCSAVSADSVIIYTSSGTISQCNIRDCLSVFGTSGSALFLSSSSTISNVFVDSCKHTFNSTSGNNTLVSCSTLSASTFDNQYVTFANTSGTNKMFSVTAINVLHLSNCSVTYGTGEGIFIDATGQVAGIYCNDLQVVFGATANNNTFIASDGNLVNSFISDSAIGFPTNSSKNIGVSVADITNMSFEGSGFIFTSSSADNYGFIAQNGNTIRISNSKFTYISKPLTVSTALQNFYLDSNVFQSEGTLGAGSFIDVGTLTDGLIQDNIVNFSSGVADAILKITSATDLIVSNNIFKSTSSTAASGNVLYITNTSESVIVSDNIFINPVSVSAGFVNAIVLAGGGGTVAGDHQHVVISGNIIKEFAASGSAGIDITNAYDVIISNNSIDGNVYALGGSGDPVTISNSWLINIEGNYLFSSENACITIAGPSTWLTQDGMISIQNNIIGHYGLAGSELISIASTVPNNGIIDNNIIFQYSLTASHAHAMVNVGANYYKITNNKFYSNLSILTLLSGIPLTYTIAPITTSGDYTLVAFNYMRGLTSTAPTGMVNNTGTRCMDYMNWGQTYSVAIPMTNAMLDYGSTNGLAITGNMYKSSVMVASNDAYGSIEFSSRDVPVGSKLTSIDVSIAHAGSTGDITFRWRKADWFEIISGSNVSNEKIPTGGTTSVTSLSPTRTTYMENDTIHSLMFYTDSSITGNIVIYGIKVTYEL